MLNFTEIKENTKKAAEIIADTFNDLGSIFEAYGSCSAAKREAWKEIEARALATPGYNHDLHVCGRYTSNFSTVYTYTDENGATYAVKDTKSYTYRTKIA